ncbi:hypothetical protein JCM10449v2_006292 [Rhodotorula kratochvilovae]
MQELGGLGYYFAEGNGRQKEKAIVVGHDLFGLGLPNPRLIADWLAGTTGLDVYVPDLMKGDYIDTSRIPPAYLQLFEEQIKGKSLYQRLRYYAIQLWTSVRYIGPLYYFRHNLYETRTLTETFCKNLREQKGHTRLGFVGYCYGGALGVHLAGVRGPLKPVDVVVAFHPAPITPVEFARVQVPFMLSCAEEDLFFDGIKRAALAALENARRTHGAPSKVYDDAAGTVHGYGSRPDLDKPEVREAFEKGRERTAQWFGRYL